MPLKPEYLELTLEALRSGMIQQERGSAGTLRGARCCIAVSATVNGFNETIDDGYLLTSRCANYIGLTPDETQEWAGWNDIHRFSFPKIANLIEKKYKK